jgi:hypothetical protein
MKEIQNNIRLRIKNAETPTFSIPLATERHKDGEHEFIVTMPRDAMVTLIKLHKQVSYHNNF